MTTIGLVSAGLLSFSQGLGLVFGANVGTTGTGWLIALVGVRVSLTAAALQASHRKATLRSVASGAMSADEAMARVDIVRRLEALARHAWRSAAHLVGSRA